MYVLRKLGSGFYSFGGEAYVHGLMDGEMLSREAGRKTRSESINDLNSDDREWLDGLAGLEMDVVFSTSKSIILV